MTKITNCIFRGIAIWLALHISLSSYSQLRGDSLLGKVNPQKLAASVERRMNSLEDKLVKKSLSTLNSLEKQEEKIYKKLLKGKDSVQARIKLQEAKGKYAQLRNKLKSDSIIGNANIYLAKLDTLSGVMKFLNNNGSAGKVKDALAATSLFQNKMQQAEEIKKFIQERRTGLKNQLQSLGLVKELKQINKQVYFYGEQLKEFKSMLNDSKKIEKKAIELLSKTNLFKEFMRKNSQLASLFRMHDANQPSYAANLAGLQTRAQINNVLQQQIGSGGMQQFRQQMQDAKSQIDQLKNKILKTGGSSSEDIMPEGFKPNTERGKPLLKKLEYSVTMQSQKATNFFPTTTDVGLTLGVKISQSKVVGIGVVYKAGLGRGWDHIKITHEGIGFKSYADLKLKGSFWFSVGYEANHWAAFQRFDQLRGLRSWSESGLAGISKVVNTRSKFFKKTKAQLLWDFLSYEQRPRTQPIVFRIGYKF